MTPPDRKNYLRHNPRVSLARVDASVPSADQNPAYRAKYAERIGSLFGSAAEFAELFAVPIVITPERVIA